MIKEFFLEESGFTTIEIAIITAVLIAVAVVFRKTIYNFCVTLASRVLGE